MGTVRKLDAMQILRDVRDFVTIHTRKTVQISSQGMKGVQKLNILRHVIFEWSFPKCFPKFSRNYLFEIISNPARLF